MAASRSSKRITIDVDGTPRRVVSISEGKDGSVFLSQRAGGRFGQSKTYEGAAIAGQVGRTLREDRISIHGSARSKKNFNVITYNFLFEGGKRFSSQNYTHAIKSGSGAAFLFTKRYSTLRDSIHCTNGSDEKNISLGAYDPSWFTLVVTIFVCDPGYRFEPIEGGFYSAMEIPVGNYKLIVMWSYLSWWSSLQDYRITLALQPSKIPEDYQNLGVPAQNLSAFFDQQLEEVRRKFLAAYRVPPHRLFYVKVPSLKTEEFHKAAQARKVNEELIQLAQHLGMPREDLVGRDLEFRAFWEPKDETGA